MKIKIMPVLEIIFSFVLISTSLVFSQEQAAEKPVAGGVPAESETQWIWGDVISIDAPSKKVSVKYLDYETDTEKDIDIIVDDKTAYENAKSIDEIRLQDIVSVDYITNPEGNNVARNISVERPEGAQDLPPEGIKEEPKAAPGLE